MACVYCGKEVPFRMRLTGEEHFCCPAHKRLYNDEHSRLGLERLLEEVSAQEEEPEGRLAGPPGSEATEEAAANPLPEPEVVASGQGLKLWTFPHIPFPLEPRFSEFSRLDFAPADYTPGKAAAVPPPAATAAIERNRPAREAAPKEKRSTRPADEAAKSPSAAPVRSKPAKGATAKKKQASRTTAQSREPHPPRAEPPEKKPTAKEVQFVTGLGGYVTDQEKAGDSRSGQRIAAGVVLAICLGAGGYLGLGIGGGDSTTKAAAVTESSTWQKWIPSWADEQRGEEIALFGPSQGWSDYKVEWEADAKTGMAWVFRAVDPDNYYAVRLNHDGGKPKLVHYAVIDGARTDVREVPLRSVSASQQRFAVELEVKGSRFTLYVEGYNVADWTDDRLESGGFGIIRSDMSVAGVDDVKVTQLDRSSASNRRRFWRGAPPDHLPEVTLIGRAPDRQQGGRMAGAEESSL